MNVVLLGPLLLFGMIFLGGVIGLVILLTSPGTRAAAGVLLSILGLLVVLAVLAKLVAVPVGIHEESRNVTAPGEDPMELHAEPAPPPAEPDVAATTAPGEPPAWLEGKSTWTRESAYWARVRVGPYPRDEAEPSSDRPLPRRLATEELRQALARDPLLREMFQETVQQAVAHYTAYLEPEHPGSIELPSSFVLDRLVAEAWQSAAPGPDAIPLEPASEYGALVDLHVLLAFDATARRDISALWRDAVVQDRMGTLGRVLVGLIALLGLLFGYLRIDFATGGRYRGRLRCAAAVAILAVVAAVLLSVAG